MQTVLELIQNAKDTFDSNDRASMDAQFALMTEGVKATIDYMKDLEDIRRVQAIANYEDPLIKQMLCHAWLASITYCDLAGNDDPNALLQVKNETCRAVVDMRRQLANVRHMVPAYRRDGIFDEFMEFLGMLIERMSHDEFKRDATESIVTMCCPIVPYSGFLKKPWNDIVGEIGEENIHPEVVPADRPPLADRVRDLALFNMREYLLTNTAAMWLYTGYSYFNDLAEVGSIGNAIDYALNVQDCHGSYRIIQEYTTLAMMYLQADKLDAKTVAALVRLLWSSSEIQDPKDTITTEMTLLNQLDDAAVEAMMNNPNAQFFKNPEKANDDEGPENFNLTTLMNYIYTTHRFYADQYTNTAYMNLPVIGGYTFYREFLIIQPKTVDDQKLDFVYCPVRDHLNDRKVAIIKFWRDGRIEVLNERQYTEEARGGLGEIEATDPDNTLETQSVESSEPM